jgi:hypothetical protein
MILLGAWLLSGCAPPKYAQAPKNAVPNRDRLPEDVYGGYITLTSRDSVILTGELIGMRNDSLFILSEKMTSVHRNNVVKARVIVHLPNNYKGTGIALTGASGLVIIQAAEYEGALGLGLGSMLLNGIGLVSAQETENMKINYYDWSEGWEKVIIYSRFPNGIPETLKLSELTARMK